MRLKLIPPLSLALLFVFSAHSSYSQVAAAAHLSGGIPITVGAGVSSYNTSWNKGQLWGGNVWIDYNFDWLPGPLSGLGLEAEGRDLSLDRPAKYAPITKQDVASGGVVYRWRHYERFRPYGKFLMGYGNTDWDGKAGVRVHQSRTVTTAGGGVEAEAMHRVWVRLDYEYQWWPDFFAVDTPGQGSLSPEGFTLGVSYHFHESSSR